MQEYIKKNLGSSNNNNTILIISNDEMKDIVKIVKSLEDSGLLFQGVGEAIQNEAKEQKGEFLSTLLGTLGARLLGNILAGKGAIAKRQGPGINRAGEGVMLFHPLTNFEIRKYYQNERRFNGFYSRNNLQEKRMGHI